MTDNVKVSATDLLGAICFDAMRITAAAHQAAAGSPFPDATQLRELIESMLAKARIIEQVMTAAEAPSMDAVAKMEVKLN